jgi:hypothetical protein
VLGCSSLYRKNQWGRVSFVVFSRKMTNEELDRQRQGGVKPMPNVTLRNGPYGIAVAVVAPPYEFLGEFLTAEGSWVVRDLDAVVQSIQDGDETEFHKAGNAHTLHIDSRSVTVQSNYRMPPTKCVISLEKFQTLLDEWKSLREKWKKKRQ